MIDIHEALIQAKIAYPNLKDDSITISAQLLPSDDNQTRVCIVLSLIVLKTQMLHFVDIALDEERSIATYLQSLRHAVNSLLVIRDSA